MPQTPPSKMNILTLTDVTGAQVLVNADQICTVHPLAEGGSKIIFAGGIGAQVRETPHTIKEAITDDGHSRPLRPGSREADQDRPG